MAEGAVSGVEKGAFGATAFCGALASPTPDFAQAERERPESRSKATIQSAAAALFDLKQAIFMV
jgi:hypothetical protein